MKKLLTIFSFLFVFACSDQDRIQNTGSTEKEKNISLISPGGAILSSDITALKSNIAKYAVTAFGNKDFVITNITYTEGKDQIASFVEFQSSDNEYGSILLINGITKKMTNGRVSASMSTPPTVVDCSGGCDAAGQTCRERVIIPADGSITYECTCQGTCKMTVTPS